MTKYTEKDLQILSSVEAIRRRPALYAGGTPSGWLLVTMLAQDLLILQAGPLEIGTVENWWTIRAEKDWLTQNGTAPSFEPFFGIQRFPERGLEAMRYEVVVATLANAVVTAAPDGIRWITGDSESPILPSPVQSILENHRHGRVVAFLMNE